MTGAPDGNAVGYFIERHVHEGRGDATAFRDPWRSLTYGALDTATRRFAGALRAAGVTRERRVALLLLDTIDFPIAFWGAIRAGVIPVPVNTLLTHETVGYILADSRAEALVISAPLVGPLLPVLHSVAELRRIVVAQPDGGTPAPIEDARTVGFDDFLASGDPATPTTATSADEVAFWLYSSGSTGAPKGVRHVHGSLRATADTYGAQVLQIHQDDLVFSAAKAFHAYGLGNCMTFPMSVGAGAVLLPDRPTPDAVLDTMQRHQPTIFAGVPTLFASLLANPRIGPGAGSERLRRCISAGEALPADIGRRWSEMVGADILDGIGSTEMLHIFVQSGGRHPLRHLGQAGARLRRDDPGRARRTRAEWRGGRTGGARAVVGRGLLEPARQDAPHVPRRVDAHRRHLYPRCGRLLSVLRPHRRDAEGERRLGFAVRGGGGAGRRTPRCWNRRW